MPGMSRNRGSFRRAARVAAEGLEGRRLLSAVKIGDVPPSYFSGARDSVSDGTHAYFFSHNAPGTSTGHVWRTDGTATGTERLGGATIYVGGNSDHPREFTLVNGRLFFLAGEGNESYGPELYTVAPGANTVEKISNFLPGGDYAYPHDLVELNGKLYLIGWSRAAGYELHVSDGTISGTRQIIQLAPGTGEYDRVSDIARVGDELYVGVQQGATRWSVYRSDGTAAGTTLLKSGTAPLYAGAPSDFARVGDKVVFNVRGYESVLWVSDGTPEGTRSLDVPGGFDITSAGDFAVYHAENTAGDGASDVYRTDGTAAGTQQLGMQFPDVYYPYVTAVNGKVLFPGYASQLHAVTKTGEATLLGSAYSLSRVGDRAYFSGTYEGVERLTRTGVTDGTYAGTQLLADRPPAAPEGNTFNFRGTRGGVVFGRDDGLYVLPYDAPALSGVSGRVFRDLDRDGVADSNEPREELARLSANVPIGPDGSYEIRWTKPGTLNVGASSTEERVVPTTPSPRTLTLNDGDRVTGVDFGFRRVNIVRGAVRRDVNLDEFASPSEPGVAGRTVYLDLDRDGTVDAGEPSTVSNATGAYELYDVPVLSRVPLRVVPGPGEYVSAPITPGYDVTTSEDGGVYNPPFSPSQLDFGLTTAPPRNYAFVRHFEDNNRNGTPDAGEPTPGGPATFWVDTDDDGALGAAETRLNWTYAAGNHGIPLILPGPGTYRIRVKPPEGWVMTTPAPVVTVGPGERVYDVMLPVAVPAPSGATLAGTMFIDTDGDGTRDDGEPVRRGRVYLDADGDFAFDADEPSVLADALGRWAFVDLPAGHYAVRQELPDYRWQQTTPAPGQPVEVDLAPGQQLTDIRFGARQVVSSAWKAITGIVYHDEDVDAQRDPAEGVFGGRPLFYLDMNNNGQHELNVEPGARAGADGRYRFDVAPGRYRLRLASGLEPTRVSTFGPDGSAVVDVTPAGNVTLDVGAYRPNVTVTDAWLEAHRSPLRAVLALADASIAAGNAVAAAVRVTGPAGQPVQPSRVTFDTRNVNVEFAAGLSPGRYTVTVPGGSLKGSPGLPTPPDYTFAFEFPPPASGVVARRVFYNASAFDERNPFPNAADDAAIAPDKSVLLPGQAPTQANLTSYVRGVNGLMLDVARLPVNAPLSAADFEFRAGNSDDPGTWETFQPLPVINVRRGAGAGGSDRVTLAWLNAGVRNAWLQVTVKATPNTGLAAPDVFYLGNLVGESGNTAPGAAPAVGVTDFARVRAAQRRAAAIDSPLDFDRSGRVDALDLRTVRQNQFHTLHALTAAATATPLRPDLRDVSDSGVSASDDVTNFNNSSAGRALSFTVGGTIAGATVTLFADGVAVGSAVATGPTTTITTGPGAALPDGLRNFTARQTLPDGSMSTASAALSVRVDTVAPDAPAAPDLEAASDRGIGDDNLTSERNPRFEIHAAPAPYWRVYRDGVRVSGEYGSGGTFTNSDVALPGGTYAFTAGAVDAAGNESVRGAPLSVTIDATPPTAAGSAASVTAAGGTDYTFTVTYSDASGVNTATIGEGDVVVTGPNFTSPAVLVSVDDLAFGSPRTATYRILAPGGEWDRTDDGTYTVGLRSGQVEDVAGGAAAGGTLATFNVAADDLPAPDLLAGTDTGASDSDNVTRLNNASAAAVLRFLVRNVIPGATVTLLVDGTPMGSAVASGGTITLATDGSTVLADGAHRISAFMSRNGVQVGEGSAVLPVTVDTVAAAPAAPVLRVGGGPPVFDVTAPEAGMLHLEADGVAGVGPVVSAPAAGAYAMSFTPSTATALGSSPVEYRDAAVPVAVTAADVNGDGRTDVVQTMFSPAQYAVLLGNGDGTFTRGERRTVVGDYVTWLGTGDVDGDGRVDLMTLQNNDNYVRIFLGNGDGTFRPAGWVDREYSDPSHVALADLTGDGRPDMVVGERNGIHVLRGNGDGTFAAGDVSTLPDPRLGPREVFVLDFDGDGELDLAASNYNWLSESDQSNVAVYLGNGDGTFRSGPRTGVLRSGKRTVAADFDGDGRPDLARIDNGRDGMGYGVSVLVNNGDGSFAAPAVWTIDAEPYGLSAADFDRDGELDLLTTMSVYDGNGVGQGYLIVLRGNGDGTFRGPERVDLHGRPQDVTLADFDRDGRLDAAAAGFVTNTGVAATSLYRGAGGPLPAGNHSVTAWLEDLAGNRSASSATTVVTVEGG